MTDKTTPKQTAKSAPLNTDAMQAAFDGIIAVIEQPTGMASLETKLQVALDFARIGKEGGALVELDGFDDTASYLQAAQQAAKPKSMAEIEAAMKCLVSDLDVALSPEQSAGINAIVRDKAGELLRFMSLAGK